MPITRQHSNNGTPADYILAIDMQQSDPATARVCQADPTHGRLTVNGKGSALMCCAYSGNMKVSKGQASAELCPYAEPLSR